MSFSYYDKDNNIKKIDINVGMQWADIKTNNENLDSIFDEVDDGDGIVQLTEKMIVDNYLKKIDTNETANSNNQILENEEIQSFNLDEAKLEQTFDKNYFTMENIKKSYPEDKYTYSSMYGGETILIKDKATGNEVLRIHSELITNSKTNTNEEFTKISESSANGMYTVNIGSSHSQIIHATGNKTDANFTFDGTQISKINDKSIAELRKTALFDNLNNPEWLKNNAIQTIDNIPSDQLIDIMQEYFKKYDKYLLNEIYKIETIDKNMKYDFLVRTLKRLEDNAGYKRELTIEDSQVNTEFYQSKDSYYVNFNNDKITIRKNNSDNTQSEEHTIDLNKFLSHVPLDMRPAIKVSMQKLPGEVIMDIAIECDYFESPAIKKGLTNRADGIFSPENDAIIVGINSVKEIKPETIIHEVGHAIDYRQEDAVPQQDNNKSDSKIRLAWNENYSILNNTDLKNEYYKAMYKYIGIDKYLIPDEESNTIRFDKEALIKDNYLTTDEKWTDKYYKKQNSAYMYTKLLEAPSELYLLAMMGHSYNTPNSAVTPELMEEFIKSLEYNRSLAEEDRHIRNNK